MAASSSSLPPLPPYPLHQLPTTTSTSDLESLVAHLLAAKRSLSSVSHVYRANELCSSTRRALEESALITARTTFLRSGITSQLGVLQQIQQGTLSTARRGKAEFEAATKDLDKAHTRLKGTLEKLRGTLVESVLRPKAEEQRNLLDFVDEGGVEGVVEVIKGVIDGAGESIKEFEEANRSFKKELGNVTKLLDGEVKDVVDTLDDRSPLPDILHEMERYAQSMARDLESLVNHYDLCVIAIKHTEGGGDVATKIAANQPDRVDIEGDVAGLPEPIGDDQREEMVRVIEGDAGDVEGAVIDIRDRLVEMENLHVQVETHKERLTKSNASATTAFKLLEAIGRKLPNCITQSQEFQVRWDCEKAKIDERLGELEGLTQFYGGFLRAYDNLIIEIGRRKTMEQRMEKEVQDARARLEKLYEDDIEEREAFRNEQGEFLPVDIWPGLMAEPLRFDIIPSDDKVTRVPDISKSVIHRAIRRVHGER